MEIKSQLNLKNDNFEQKKNRQILTWNEKKNQLEMKKESSLRVKFS